MTSLGKSPHKREASSPDRSRFRRNDPATRAVVLLNAAVAGIIGLFSATGSAFVTLIGFSVAAVLTGWYLWTRREAR
jgi:hypothetical protein